MVIVAFYTTSHKDEDFVSFRFILYYFLKTIVEPVIVHGIYLVNAHKLMEMVYCLFGEVEGA